jgi:hypothetical protein
MPFNFQSVAAAKQTTTATNKDRGRQQGLQVSWDAGP